MNLRSVIQSFLAGFLLILFAFSITPRQALHDHLAHHQEGDSHPRCLLGPNITHFSADGFHCDCDNLVAESPFTYDVFFIEFHAAPVLAGRPLTALRRFYSQTHFFFSLRGPPAV